MRPNRRGCTGYRVCAEVALHGERIRRPPLLGDEPVPHFCGSEPPSGWGTASSRAAPLTVAGGRGRSRRRRLSADVRGGPVVMPACGTFVAVVAVDGGDAARWRSSAEYERLGRNKISPVQVGQYAAQINTVVGIPAAISRPITGSSRRRRDRAGSAAIGRGPGSGRSGRARAGEPARCGCFEWCELWLVAVERL